MIITFLISLFLTFIIIRLGAHLLHDEKYYNTKKERSKTPTYYLRKLIKKDIHHIHLGFLLLILTLITIIITNINKITISLLAISLSLIADQITPLIDKKYNYFSKQRIIESLLIHIAIAITAVLVLT